MSKREELVRSLVGEDEDLYHRNAWFKLAVDTLSEFLPALVDGLALQAEKKQQEMSDAIKKMETVRGILNTGFMNNIKSPRGME